ncbi:MAG: hypothetical protein JO092_06150 [Candidatus Eremiobacteraeota bacterium]|nr:hypothetical protein [Candidatus Eremiobacteraeota bacterium]
MNLRLGAYFAAALFLAACQGLSNSQTSNLLPSQNPQAKSPAAKPAPKYSLAIVLPDRAVRPDTLSAYVGSLKATTFIKKKRYVEIVDAPPACALGGSTTVSGCSTLYDGTATITIKSASFELYKEQHAKGCILAKAAFKGSAGYNSTVASTYKPENTKTCWK